MPLHEHIIFQPYEMRKSGKGPARLSPASPILCRTLNEAMRRLEKVKTQELRFAGAHVVRSLVDEEAGDYGEPEILGAAGEVPSED